MKNKEKKSAQTRNSTRHKINITNTQTEKTKKSIVSFFFLSFDTTRNKKRAHTHTLTV